MCRFSRQQKTTAVMLTEYTLMTCIGHETITPGARAAKDIQFPTSGLRGSFGAHFYAMGVLRQPASDRQSQADLREVMLADSREVNSALFSRLDGSGFGENTDLGVSD